MAQEQLHECVDLLQNLNVLTTELLHACAAIDETWEAPRPIDGDESETGPGRFSPGCDIDIGGADPSSFRCITAGYDPQTGRKVGEPDRCGGLDYIGLLKGNDSRAGIGVVESLGSNWCLRVDPNDLMANLAFEWRIQSREHAGQRTQKSPAALWFVASRLHLAFVDQLRFLFLLFLILSGPAFCLGHVELGFGLGHGDLRVRGDPALRLVRIGPAGCQQPDHSQHQDDFKRAFHGRSLLSHHTPVV